MKGMPMGIISGSAERRRSYRSELHLQAAYREYGTRARMVVLILDLSATGFRMETSALLSPGQMLFLELPGFEPRQAQVAWTRDKQYGCAFEVPLHVAVVDHIARAAPLPTAMLVSHDR